MIWQFGELGYDFSINNNSDGSGYDDQGGFVPTPSRYVGTTFEDADRKKLYETYAALLDLRHSYPELFASNTTFSWKVGTANWDNGRTFVGYFH